MRPRFGGTGKWHPLSILIVEAISCALMRFLHQFGEKHVSCLPRGVRIATRRNSGRTSHRTAAADDRPLFQKAQRLPDRPRWSFLRPSHTTIRQKNIAHLPKKLPPPFRHPDRRIGRRSAGSWLDHNGEARIAGGKTEMARRLGKNRSAQGEANGLRQETIFFVESIAKTSLRLLLVAPGFEQTFQFGQDEQVLFSARCLL